MRFCITVFFGLLAGAAFLAAPSGTAGEKEKGLKVEGELTTDNPKDENNPIPQMRSHYCKVHTFKMTAGRKYQIDMKSTEIDPYLRLEDPTGKQVAFNDDIAPNDLNSRIVYFADKAGTYKIIATNFIHEKIRSAKTGKYTLTVVDLGAPSPEELLIDREKKNIRNQSPEERKQFVQALTKVYTAKKDKLDLQDLILAYQVGQVLENSAKDEAPEFYATFGKLLVGSSDPKVAGFAKKLEGAARRLKLPGKEMVLKGTNLEGKEVDLKSYRGKVVLVDFWATWCPPCIAELPNVKKLYETYHDRGFEVVGISQDRTMDALTKFLEKEKLPWINLYDQEKGNGLGDFYGAFTIPLAILVDREGRVVSMNARGAELGRLLEKYLPEKK